MRNITDNNSTRINDHRTRRIVKHAVCVTRFDQSECVICGVIFALGKSRVQRYMW